MYIKFYINRFKQKNNINEYNITIETTTVKSTSKNLIVDSFKVYRQNGQVIKKEKISRDTYKKLN